MLRLFARLILFVAVGTLAAVGGAAAMRTLQRACFATYQCCPLPDCGCGCRDGLACHCRDE